AGAVEGDGGRPRRGHLTTKDHGNPKVEGARTLAALAGDLDVAGRRRHQAAGALDIHTAVAVRAGAAGAVEGDGGRPRRGHLAPTEHANARIEAAGTLAALSGNLD